MEGKRTRGIGPRQRMVLRALKALDDENRAREWPLFGDFAVYDLLHQLAGMMNRPPERERPKMPTQEEHMAELIRRTVAGDEEAKREINIIANLRRYRAQNPPRPWSGGRHSQRRGAAWVERVLNPSRILAQLERRGLVQRNGGKGEARVRLTEAGREMAAE